MRLQNKVALITGAGSGIGRETAILFAAEGAKVVIADLNEADLNITETNIHSTVSNVSKVPADVTKDKDCSHMVSAAIAAHGKIDILVNSAGVTNRNAMPRGASPESVWEKVIEINLKGTYLPTLHVVPQMRRVGEGSIINLGSIGSLVGYPASRAMGFDPYPASKGAVLQFTRNLAVQLAQEKIRVNCICPGHLDTNLNRELTNDPATLEALLKRYPMGRIGHPKEVAYAALFLASDESSFVTGTHLVVDGGYTAQ